jgi:hypothetical protein
MNDEQDFLSVIDAIQGEGMNPLWGDNPPPSQTARGGLSPSPSLGPLDEDVEPTARSD